MLTGNRTKEKSKRHTFMNKRRRGRKKKILFQTLLMLAAVVITFMMGHYYPAADEALASLKEENRSYTVSRIENDWLFMPEDSADTEIGLVFYPGGGVQCEAYAPLMECLAERGICCVLADMPGDYAFTRINAAEKIIGELPDIKHWYIGGHSLGGAVAAICLENYKEDFEGLLLCASFSSVDLSNTDMKVLSVFGTEDGVLNKSQYDHYTKYLPDDFTEYQIEGGCHSFFGDYGMQKGDGSPAVAREEQMEKTADAFMQMVTEG